VNRFPSTCRWIALLALLATSVLFACGRAPSLQEPNLHSLSGRVRLIGTTIDANGKVGATRVVDDADGVLVELLSGHDVIARAQTIHGVYTFPGLAPGAYQTQAFVSANVWDKSAVFTIVKTDLAAGDTLRLTSLGDLYPVPNPVVTESTIYFELPDSMMVDVRIKDMAGQTVRRLLQAPRWAGINQVVWNGSDSLDVPVQGRHYWVTLDAGTDQRAQLIFR
jgi:hypothetical protein